MLSKLRQGPGRKVSPPRTLKYSSKHVVTPVPAARAAGDAAFPASGNFHETGDQQLRQWFRWAFGRMSHSDVVDLASARKRRERRKLGTVCSGTDSPVLIIRHMEAAALDFFKDRGVQVQHCFAAEADERKQAFLMGVFDHGMDALFQDACELGAGRPTAADVISGEQKPIAAVQDLIGGFPCVDTSTLSSSRRMTTVRDGSFRTGKVFRSMVDYAASDLGNDLDGLIAENVLGLITPPKGSDENGKPHHSNLDYCILYLETDGDFFVIVFKLAPSFFGYPVSRPRLWFICIPMPILRAARVHREEAVAALCELVSSFLVGDVERDLDEFLLPDDHPMIQNLLGTAAVKQATRAATQKAIAAKSFSSSSTSHPTRRGTAWPQKHAAHSDVSGLDYWEPWASELEASLYPGLADLTDRQQDLLRLSGVKIPDCKKTINVGMSLGYARPKADKSTIVTPKCELWLAHRVRMMAGIESLALQGIHYGNAQSKLDIYDDSLLKDLGGNAFMSLCCGVCVLSKDIFVARCLARAESVMHAANSMPSMVAPSLNLDNLDDVLSFDIGDTAGGAGASAEEGMQQSGEGVKIFKRKFTLDFPGSEPVSASAVCSSEGPTFKRSFTLCFPEGESSSSSH